jgi:hypothetical protein
MGGPTLFDPLWRPAFVEAPWGHPLEATLGGTPLGYSILVPHLVYRYCGTPFAYPPWVTPIR